MNNMSFIKNYGSEEEMKRSGKFWKKSFLIYAGIEIIILGLQVIITRSKCAECVMPPAFYTIIWLQHLMFTGLLWICLNYFYKLQTWKIIASNIVLFLSYYFLWFGLQYLILHSGQIWISGNSTSIQSFRELVYWSWYEIGKYVLKLIAFYVLKFYYEYRRAERQRIELAVINKDMQVNLLKQQLSPHFYFNTLNNLYGLARGNNEKLSEALHQLQNIMRYVIEDCNQPKVLLSQEINFLQSYIALEKLRYEQNTVIEMKVQGEPDGQSIIPLLLIQFVENAFKHGMKEKSDRNWMKANMQINNDELQFEVDNSYYDATISQGIGINSVKHILNLQYEGKYDMKMLHEENRFSVTLKLNLS